MRLIPRILPSGRAVLFLPDTTAPRGFIYTHPDGLLPDTAFSTSSRPRTPREHAAADYVVNSYAAELRPTMLERFRAWIALTLGINP